MLTAEVIGAERVVVKLQTKDIAYARDNVSREVIALGLTLERRVKLEKLMGQVLSRRSGRGVRSINTRVVVPNENTFISSTGTNLWYMRMWERFGHKAYTVFPKFKKALYWKGARHPVHSVHIPAEGPRPFLRPTLDEMRPEIQRRIQAAAAIR